MAVSRSCTVTHCLQTDFWYSWKLLMGEGCICSNKENPASTSRSCFPGILNRQYTGNKYLVRLQCLLISYILLLSLNVYVCFCSSPKQKVNQQLQVIPSKPVTGPVSHSTLLTAALEWYYLEKLTPYLRFKQHETLVSQQGMQGQ